MVAGVLYELWARMLQRIGCAGREGAQKLDVVKSVPSDHRGSVHPRVSLSPGAKAVLIDVVGMRSGYIQWTEGSKNSGNMFITCYHEHRVLLYSW